MKKTYMSGYSIVKIAITETNFTCSLNLQKTDIEKKLNFYFSNSFLENNILQCNLHLEYESTYADGTNECKAHIVVSGLFEQQTVNSLAMKDFANINAPSILFPYLREHLAILSLKAGIDVILLEPVNFIALASENNN